MYIKVSEDGKTETRKYSEYIHKMPVKSFIDGADIYAEDHFHCPKCNKQYGLSFISGMNESVDCECGLHMFFKKDDGIGETVIDCTLREDGKTQEEDFSIIVHNTGVGDKCKNHNSPMGMMGGPGCVEDYDSDKGKYVKPRTQVRGDREKLCKVACPNMGTKETCKYYKKTMSVYGCFYRDRHNDCNNPYVTKAVRQDCIKVDCELKCPERHVRGEEENKCEVSLETDSFLCRELSRTLELSVCRYFIGRNETQEECYFYEDNGTCSNKRARIATLPLLFNKINSIVKQCAEDK